MTEINGLAALDIDALDEVIQKLIEVGKADELTAFGEALCARVQQEFEKEDMIAPPMLLSMAQACVFVGTCAEKGADTDKLARALIKPSVRFLAKINGIDEEARNVDMLSLLRCIELAFVAVWMRVSSAVRKEIAETKEGRQMRKESIELRWNARLLHHAACLLDDEELVVLAPGLAFGARVRVRGVSNNLQLVVLLAALVHQHLGDKATFAKPPDEVLKVVRGESELSLDLTHDHYTTPFNMYNYFALDNMCKLRGPSMGLPDTGSWVWVEGVPADIEPFDALPGQPRVVLLGKAPYERRAQLFREFAALRADVELVELLDARACAAALERMATLSDEQRQAAAARVRQDTNVGREAWVGRPELEQR